LGPGGGGVKFLGIKKMEIANSSAENQKTLPFV